MRCFSNWRLSGLERQLEAARFVNTEWGIPVFVGPVEECLPSEPRFDIITLWDVFEHLRDPEVALERLRMALRPSGILVIKMPNPTCLAARLFRSAWYGWAVPQHYFAWPRRVFESFVTDRGFRVVQTKYIYGAYSDHITSIGFALHGLIPTRLGRMLTRVLSNEVFETLATPLLTFESAVMGGSSLTYFLARKGA
jgi:hypothetical protein